MDVEEIDKLYENAFKLAQKDGIKICEGDLIIPRKIVLKTKEIGNLGIIYLSAYYMNNKNLVKTDASCYNYTKQQIQRIKKKLVQKGYIEKKKYSKEQLKDKTIELSHKGRVCEWCGKESYILQKHHYPISSKEGGKEIVNICPNCHYTFHSLEGE